MMQRLIIVALCLAFVQLLLGCQTIALHPSELYGKEDTQPSYQGTWSGTNAPGLHVTKIIVKGATFPCNGLVEYQYGRGQIFRTDVTWHRRDGYIEGLTGSKTVAIGVATQGNLTGKVISLVTIGGVKEIPFRNLKRAK